MLQEIGYLNSIKIKTTNEFFLPIVIGKERKILKDIEIRLSLKRFGILQKNYSMQSQKLGVSIN
jgi:hypothetical protein